VTARYTGTVDDSTTTTIEDTSRTEPDGYFVGWTIKQGSQSAVVTASAWDAGVGAYKFTFAAMASAPTQFASYTLSLPNALTTEYTYNPAGQVDSVSQARAARHDPDPQHDEYDALGRTTKTHPGTT
jgi:hypothetical protein